MPILALEALLCENKKFQLQNVNPVSIETLDLWFHVQHFPFWASLAFACKSETSGSLRSRDLLVLTKSSKSKNQVVHEQNFKELLSSTWQISSERRVLDVESVVQGSSTHWR